MCIILLTCESVHNLNVSWQVPLQYLEHNYYCYIEIVPTGTWYHVPCVMVDSSQLHVPNTLYEYPTVVLYSIHNSMYPIPYILQDYYTVYTYNLYKIHLLAGTEKHVFMF